MKYFLIIFFCLLVGCGKFSSKIKSESDQTILLRYDVKTFDPAAIQDWTTGHVLGKIYPSVGALCMIETTDHINFKLTVKPARFSNSEAVTSEDIRHTIQRCLVPAVQSGTGSGFALQIFGANEYANDKTTTVTGIRIVSSDKLTINLSKPDISFREKLSSNSFGVLNHKVTPGKEPLDIFTIGAGAGKYVVLRYTAGSEWLLENRISKEIVKYRYVGDSSTRRSLFDNKQADLAYFAPHEIGVVKNHPNLTSGGPRTLVYIQMNPKTQASLTPSVRSELAKMTSTFRTQACQILDGKVRPIANLFGTDAEPVYQSGTLPMGKFELVYADIGMQNPIAEFIITEWRQKGVTITGRPMVSAGLLEANSRGDLAFLFTGWQPDFDGPLNTIPMLMHSNSPENHSGYSNKDVDTLIENAQRGIDTESNIKKAHEIAMKDVRWIPLYEQRDLVLQR
jgi:ABC-type transport system substrate-binding protein